MKSTWCIVGLAGLVACTKARSSEQAPVGSAHTRLTVSAPAPPPEVALDAAGSPSLPRDERGPTIGAEAVIDPVPVNADGGVRPAQAMSSVLGSTSSPVGGGTRSSW